MKRIITLGLVVLAPWAAAERSPFEQGIVEWAKTRNYVHVESRGSTTGTYLLPDITGTTNLHSKLYDAQGDLNASAFQQILSRYDSVAAGFAANGDAELAKAIATAALDVRLNWLGDSLDQSQASARYNGTIKRLAQFEPYHLPQRLKSAELVLDASLLFKGYAIDMYLANQRIANALSPAERTKADEIARLTKRQAYLFNLQWQAARKKQGLSRQLDQELRAINARMAKLSESDRSLRPQTAFGLMPTLTEIQSLLDEDTLAIDIVIARSPEDKAYSSTAKAKNIYLATAFDRTQIHGPFNLGSVESIDRLVKAITAGMNAKADASPTLVSNTQQLRKLLFDPLIKHADGKKRLFISLDGELQFAPIPMLPDATNRFLVQDFEVSFFDSFRQLVNTSSWRSSKPAKRSVLLGDPHYLSDALAAKLGSKAQTRMLSQLAGTRREIEGAAQVMKLRGDAATTLLGTGATEAGFYTAMKEPAEILHFATHGCFFDPTSSTRDPLQLAALALGNSEDTLRLKGLSPQPLPNDGLLQASEILKLDLRDSRLVILSACSTAMGEAIPGDLVMGFRGAFFIAGAPNVILTLIPVSDAICPILMTNLYKNLPGSRDECAAWTQTVRFLINDPYFTDPAIVIKLLGPFVLVSNRPSGANNWPVAPVRGFINWRRPLATHKYLETLNKDPQVRLFLTDGFRKRLATIDSPLFGLVPAEARVISVDTDGDESFIKVAANDQNSVFIAVKEDGAWLIDDIIQTIPSPTPEP